MKTALLSLIIFTLGQETITRPVCLPISGAAKIWMNAKLRWVWIGEVHGSNESPAAFGDLVCAAIASGKQVTVALERPSSEQAALENFLTERDADTARTVLLQQPGWQHGLDGRASEAMLQLMIRLRAMHKSYPTLKVFAMEAPYDATQGARDEAMGKALLSVRPLEKDGLILVLSGNVHAVRARQFSYDSAAMFLPSDELLSLEVSNRRGSQVWSMTDEGCGVTSGGVADRDEARPLGVYLDPKLALFGKVDGILALGRPLTASLPAVGEQNPLPLCRVKFLGKPKITAN